jgi:hypothetical protein
MMGLPSVLALLLAIAATCQNVTVMGPTPRPAVQRRSLAADRFGSTQRRRTATTVVAVNGENLTSSEFAHLVHGARQARAGALDDSLNADAVVDAVDQVLAAQQGHLLGYAMTDEQFDRVLQNLRKTHGIESEVQFEAALLDEGLSRSDLRRNLERQMIYSRLRNNLTRENVDLGALRNSANIVWSDNNLRQLYERGLSRRPQVVPQARY